MEEEIEEEEEEEEVVEEEEVGCFYYCINDARSHKHQKSNPCTSLDSPEGSRSLRFSDFMKIGT